MLKHKYGMVSRSYTAHSQKDVRVWEDCLKNDGFKFAEEIGVYRYYTNFVGCTAEIYMKFKTV